MSKLFFVSDLVNFRTSKISLNAETSSVCLGGSFSSTVLRTNCPITRNIKDRIIQTIEVRKASFIPSKSIGILLSIFLTSKFLKPR